MLGGNAPDNGGFAPGGKGRESVAVMQRKSDPASERFRPRAGYGKGTPVFLKAAC
jgi:hypothetical protein